MPSVRTLSGSVFFQYLSAYEGGFFNPSTNNTIFPTGSGTYGADLDTLDDPVWQETLITRSWTNGNTFDDGSFVGTPTIPGDWRDPWVVDNLVFVVAVVTPNTFDEDVHEWTFIDPIWLIKFDDVDQTGFAPVPPPVQPSAEDDFVYFAPGWIPWDIDTSGYTAVSSAEDDFVYSLPGWPAYDDDASGFSPLPPLVQPSAEDDVLQTLPGWIPYEVDNSGFFTLPPLVQAGTDDDFQSMWQGSLASLVPLDEQGFVMALPASQIIWLN